MDTSSRHSLWDDFLAAWPPERVQAMPLEEYTNPDKNDAFIYWLEARLNDLGSIWGGSAFKFGIYYRDDSTLKEAKGGRIWGEHYAWQSKFGKTEHEAFLTIRNRLWEVIEAAKAGNIERIDQIDLSQVLKWKVAFLYQDREHPIIFPIFKKEALFYHFRQINPGATLNGTPHSVLYVTLMDRYKDKGDVFDIYLHLWDQYQAGKDLQSRTWAVPLSYILDPDGISGLCSKQTIEPEDIDPFLNNLLASANLAEGDQIVLIDGSEVRAIGMLLNVTPDLFAWEQRPVNPPIPSNLLVNPTSEIRELTAAERKSIWDQLPNHEAHSPAVPAASPTVLEASVPESKAPCYPQNIILYGPPGTGKTYSTIRRALELILGSQRLEGLTETGLMAQFRNLQAQGQIEFVTFHQAYGYEEFVEGIRPVIDGPDSVEVRYELHAGAFKRIAIRAAAEGLRNQMEAPSFDTLWIRLLKELNYEEERVTQSTTGKTYLLRATNKGNLEAVPSIIHDDGSVQPSSDSSLRISRDIMRLVWENRQLLGPEPKDLTSEKTKRLIGESFGTKGGHNFTPLWIAYQELYALHESMSRKPERGDTAARVQDVLDRSSVGKADFAFSAATPQYVLIVDEINRGNMSKILGELITLLEPDKRLGAANELKLPLSYSPTHRFAVPPNLHILGTMNTADRSIALMDVALRRRFTFEELMPDSSVIRQVLRRAVPQEAFIDLVVDLFETLNSRIRFLYDRDHQLGHAYFLGATTPEALRQVFVDRVIPLLQEYFYGAWEKIAMVLGCPYDEAGNPRRGGHLLRSPGSGKPGYLAPMVSATLFAEEAALGFDHDEFEDRLDFTVNRDFQEGTLSLEGLLRCFLGVLNIDQDAYETRFQALLAELAPDEVALVMDTV